MVVVMLVATLSWAVVASLWPAIAEAAARVTLPQGWGESAAAASEAQRRASRWQEALGLRLAQVISAPDDDRFAETVAVFERGEPVSEETFADEARAVAALSKAVTGVMGTQAPDEAELRQTQAGETFVWGRWTIDELHYECVLAPSGGTASVVIAAVLAREARPHGETLTTLFSELEGVSAPMPRFSLRGWRLGSILLWMSLALGVHAAMLPFGDRQHDHGQAGTRASGINLGLVLLGTGVGFFVLRGRELALDHAGSSVAGMTVWVLVSGLIVVGVHFLIASRFDRGPIRSAPSTGAFASGTYSSVEVIRASMSRSGQWPADQSSVDNQPPPSHSGVSDSPPAQPSASQSRGTYYGRPGEDPRPRE